VADEGGKVNYKKVADDPKKSCTNCKHFKPKEGGMGDCFGYKVSAKGSCNLFEEKEEKE
jgi:hypothetical protein